MRFNFHVHEPKGNPVEIFNLENLTEKRLSYYSVGIHPFREVKHIDFEFLLHEANCLAIGECGLDKNSPVDFKHQEELFIQQVALSELYELPLIIHCVKAWNELSNIKKKLNPKQTWIFHGFRKTALLDDVLSSGLTIGIGPAILYDKKLQEAIKQIPAEKILTETDDQPHVDIEEIYQKIAELKGINLNQLEMQLEENFRRIFTKFG